MLQGVAASDVGFDAAGGLPALCGGAGTSRSPVQSGLGESIPIARMLLVGDPLTKHDLHYWDGLANQDEVIQLSADEDYYEGRRSRRQRRLAAVPP